MGKHAADLRFIGFKDSEWFQDVLVKAEAHMAHVYDTNPDGVTTWYREFREAQAGREGAVVCGLTERTSEGGNHV